MININKIDKIYIACPAAVATGGPELLQQLCFCLREKLKINSFIYYYGNQKDLINPIHESYKIYDNPYVSAIEDKETNILIVPEVVNAQTILSNYSKITKICWWLSVDNFYYSFRFVKFIRKIKEKLSIKTINHFNGWYFVRLLRNSPAFVFSNFHMVQSVYAKNHLLSLGIDNNRIFYLSDYLNYDFLKTKVDLAKKNNFVAYNPKKGLSFTSKLIKSNPDITFIPLVNMNRGEVLENLSKAKVYIDFGNHPGKDRIPREAAILYCCVITNKQGSANFFEDVSIPEEYKFDDNNIENFSNIGEKIRECFRDYDKKINDFHCYREKIKKEPMVFLDNLKEIFKK